MVKLWEEELYKALRELREAEEAFSHAKWEVNSLRMKGIRKGKPDAIAAQYAAKQKLEDAQDAADQLLASFADEMKQDAKLFGGNFVEQN